MKILIVGDVHWSETSSIIRAQGAAYSQRLENLINTLNWVEDQSVKYGCRRVVYLGDFFDKSTASDKELTALKCIKWNENIPHDFIVGNHESSVSDLRYNSTKVLERDNFIIHAKVNSGILDDETKTQVIYLPYITEDNRKPLSEYLNLEPGFKHIVFSHNDIKGIKYGPIESKVGFPIEDIERCGVDYYFNGHLHNGSWLNNKICHAKICNAGNITGQNFCEDAYRYAHKVYILDTDTLEVTEIENPVAFNFIQMDVNTEKDIDTLRFKKKHMVVNFKCKDTLVTSLREKLKRFSEEELAAYRIMSIKTLSTESTDTIQLEVVDSSKKFTDFMLERLGNTDIVKQEIMEVIK